MHQQPQHMHCPLCKIRLQPTTLLDTKVPAYQCPKCEGNWIPADEYLRWVTAQPTILEPKIVPHPDLPDWDVAQLKLCPGCGHFLTRYRVLPHTRFYVDRCTHCNGVWLDHHEWDVLVEHRLHDQLNDLFTKQWQAKIREAEARATMEALYIEKFGAEDYQKLQEMRAWLLERDQCAMMLAYLQARDPYKV